MRPLFGDMGHMLLPWNPRAPTFISHRPILLVFFLLLTFLPLSFFSYFFFVSFYVIYYSLSLFNFIYSLVFLLVYSLFLPFLLLLSFVSFSLTSTCLYTTVLNDKKLHTVHVLTYVRRNICCVRGTTVAMETHNAFHLYFCWPMCHCRQYKAFQYCHWDAITSSSCTVVNGQNNSYCYQQ